ncbi:calcium-activated chloride channel-domain-containing protein [Parasitella parasitica]|nr:calcium-activated chloride channel-domain-containing protein [Parasitella parasitica]
MAGVDHQKPIIANTDKFQHLFPPAVENSTGATPAADTDETPTSNAPAPQAAPIPTKSKSTDSLNSNGSSIVSCNAGIDYVIVFRFPVQLSKKDKALTSRAQLETKVASSLTSITNRLAKVNLRFQVRPGKENGTLLILVSSPVGPIKKEYRQERVRDFLLGVRVDEIGDESNNTNNVDQAFEDLTEAERLRLVYEILTQPESEGGAGISVEVDDYVESIMPLHDDKFNNNWLKSWSTKSLIDDNDLLTIRDHFGEKIAYYFAFLQSYFLWLSAPTVVGILVYLTHSNTLAVWFSLFMLLWAILFTEMWRRKEAELAIKWGVRNYSKHEKRRAEFKGEKMVKDHVTGEDIPFVSAWKLLGRRLAAIPGVAVGAFLLTVIVGFVFVLQLFLHEYYNGPFAKFLHYAPTVGYVLLIPSMTKIYSKWVKTLTDWEMQKTDAQWEYSYTQKIFIANFLVGYLSLFITAWIYIPFGDHVLPYLTNLNISHEHRTVDFQRLRAQLVYFIVTGQLVGFLTEMVVPYAMKNYVPKAKKMVSKKKTSTSSSSAKEKNLVAAFEDEEEEKFMNKVYKEVDMEEYAIYTDYVEMVIQFGYVSMFSTVWPLTALCAMVNNWVELRGDAAKVCKYTRRPIPYRAESIGPWLGNMETLVWLSSITMSSFAYLFHPSTQIHSSYTPVFTLLAILMSEHLFIALRFGVRKALNLVPSMAEWLVRKEEYNLKKVWLERMVGNHQQFVARHSLEIEDENSAFAGDDLGSKLWRHHLNRQAETNGAIQLVQNAFKTK